MTQPDLSIFTPALKTLRCDQKGRVTIGSTLPQARGQVFAAAVDPQGRVLLTPLDSQLAAPESSAAVKAIEHG